MSSSATGVGMPICFLGAILLILTQKSSQKFGDVLGIMVLDLSLTKTGDSAESLLCFCYVLQKVFFCVLKPYGITFIKVCL